MRTPVSSVLKGHLIRPLLIQIQKAKVDAGLALSALDHLLRSNELNFAFLALLPTFGLLILSVSWIKSKLNSWKGIGKKNAYEMMRLALWYSFFCISLTMTISEIEKTLNREPKLSVKGQGLILIEIFHLRSLSTFLSFQVKSRFLKDLKELEFIFNENWESRQGLETCRRMRNSYVFLNLFF